MTPANLSVARILPGQIVSACQSERILWGTHDEFRVARKSMTPARSIKFGARNMRLLLFSLRVIFHYGPVVSPCVRLVFVLCQCRACSSALNRSFLMRMNCGSFLEVEHFYCSVLCCCQLTTDGGNLHSLAKRNCKHTNSDVAAEQEGGGHQERKGERKECGLHNQIERPMTRADFGTKPFYPK